ncbi:patatin-like phospholipase family protein [Emticicia fontis]
MKIGLALSGGGSRGFAHLGVIKALEEVGLKPDMITGTSAGSIVGAMIAAGYTPDYIFEAIVSAGIFSHIKFAFNRFGLFKLEKLQDLFLKYIPHNSFEQLRMPLTICATDLERGEAVYFKEGELIKPILASCCLPGIFEPVRFEGRTLIDGGIVDNLPIGPLEQSCDFIIGVNIMPVNNNMAINSFKDVLMKSLFLSIRNNSGEKLRRCHLAIEPAEIYRYDGLNMSKAKEMFDLGYECTIREWEKKLLQVM